MTTVVSAIFRLRRDTAANWTAANPVLSLGEPGLETDTRLVKYGDGTTAWNSLAYSTVAGLAETVQDIVGAMLVAGANVTVTYDDPAGTATIAVTGTLPAARMPAYSGDVSSSAGSTVLTMPTVNASPGSFGAANKTITGTVTGKGLVPAFAETPIAITASQVTDFSEATDDRVAALLTAGSNISLTYNDAGNALTVALTSSPALAGTPTAPTAANATSNTQIATTAFVHALVTDLINASPATLDTLKELADAIGDDPNFATTVATSVATKLSKASNLSDLTNAGTARTNLGVAIGSNVQAWDPDLDAIAALTGTNTIYYRSAANTWSAVTLGGTLTFSAGTLSVTGAAVTKTDDTNVTLTLGGSPTTGAVNAYSLTLGWTGTLAVARGGTGGGTASGTLLDNITGFASTGVMARTAAGTYAFRTVTGTANEISLANGDGVSANPTLSLPSALTFTGKTITAGTYVNIATQGFVSYDKLSSAVSRLQIGIGAGTGGLVADDPYFISLNATIHWVGGATGTTPLANLDTTGFAPISTTTASAANVFQSASMSVLLRSTSSARYKTAITDLKDADADKVLKLRPITYRSKALADDGRRKHWGLIAEEVAEHLSPLVHRNPEGEPESVQYERVVVGLLSVVKRLEQRVAALETALAAAA